MFRRTIHTGSGNTKTDGFAFCSAAFCVTCRNIAVQHPQPIDDALDAVTRALSANNASKLTSLLLDQVLLAQAPDGNVGALVTSADASAWLKARWGEQRSITAHDYIEHFVMLEITTQGWANLAPLEHGRIIFHLHRYNAQGKGEALNGQWRIDAILYQ